MVRKKNLLLGPYNLPTSVEKNRHILLQGFHWESHKTNWFTMLQSFVGDIKALGFTYVWIPPFSKSADKQGYLPNAWFDFNSEYGTNDELKRLAQTLTENKIGLMADMVLNHRVGNTNWTDFTQPVLGLDAITEDDECGIGQGQQDTGAPYSAARDLDHSNKEVREAIIYWIQKIKQELGVTGLRFDFAKGFARQYLTEYINRTQPALSVAEYWIDYNVNDPEKGRSHYFDWLTEANDKLMAFDFPTKMLLQEAVRNGDYSRLALKTGVNNAAGVIGIAPGRSVTFIDNHDTGPSMGEGQNYSPFPAEHVMQGMAYILTHPGIPCLYWPHVFMWGLQNEVAEIIKIRQYTNIQSRSQLVIHQANKDHYVAEIDSKLMLKIGPSFWKPEKKAWQLKAYGEQYAIWCK